MKKSDANDETIDAKSVANSESKNGLVKLSNSKRTAFKSRVTMAKFVTRELDNNDHINVLLTQKTRPKPLLYDSDCNYSLYIFSKSNCFRRACWKLVTSTYFEGFIIVMIALSSILLAVGTFYLKNPNAEVEKIINIINLVFVICFDLEALVKIIAYGLIFNATSYLKDFWNILDFAVAVASSADVIVVGIDIPMVMVLRLLRTFRPLRFLSHNKDMKLLVKTLFKSMGAICNTIILILIILVVFSIVGVSLFAGRSQYCSVNPYEYSTKSECVKNSGSWRTYDHNFDNVINGLIYLFQLTTEDNWPETVYNVVDSTGIEKGPKKDASWYFAYYHVIFIFIGSMFLTNLFVGVMSYNFTKVQKQESDNIEGLKLDEDQQNWIEIQKLILRSVPNFNVWTMPPEGSWRLKFHSIVTNIYFELFVAVVILLNMIQMAMLYKGASDTYLAALEIINYAFTGIFTLEIILKLLGFGLDFWYEAWNIFDLVVVICSYVDIVFGAFTEDSLRLLRVGPQLIRVLRVLRVARLLRLVRKYKRLQAIMEIIQMCLPSILNVFALLTLTLFIFAILGCYLFYDVPETGAINPYNNFSNFGNAMMLCFQIATGENWDRIMFDCARTSYDCAAGINCGKWYAYAYFICFKIVVTYIMLNLFVLVVLQLFEKYFLEDDNAVSVFKEDFDMFQEAWLESKPTLHGLLLPQHKIFDFFRSLPERFGFDISDINILALQISALNIKCDEERNICFNELLYCTLRPLYTFEMEISEVIQKKEREARKQIFKMAQNLAKDSSGKAFLGRKVFPFLSLMIARTLLKMWKKYAKDPKQMENIDSAKIKEESF